MIWTGDDNQIEHRLPSFCLGVFGHIIRRFFLAPFNLRKLLRIVVTAVVIVTVIVAFVVIRTFLYLESFWRNLSSASLRKLSGQSPVKAWMQSAHLRIRYPYVAWLLVSRKNLSFFF